MKRQNDPEAISYIALSLLIWAAAYLTLMAHR